MKGRGGKQDLEARSEVEMAGLIPVLDRTEQQRNFGIDCGDSVRFDAGTWLPGGEHVKKLIVKNVSRRTIKFKYELPTTKYFSMDFPTLITLSPGMHTALDIAFRPLKVEEYDDFVTFSVQIVEGGVVSSSGCFRVPVIARIAKLGFELPHGLDFGFCPTAETTELKFPLRNTGQVDLNFDWTVPGAGDHGRPFSIHPESGQVRVGETLELTASFSPAIASVYVTTTVCLARPIRSDGSGNMCEHSMKLSGISKFTHIVASETELNFGEVLVGAGNTSRVPTEKEFVLRNRSLVRASFQIVRVENDCDTVFAFTPTSGVVPPESSVTIHVQYTPSSAGAFTCDHYVIVTPGGNREEITCKGRAIGPSVTLWKTNLASNFVRARSLDFGDIQVGQTTSRVVTLRNESPVEVCFHFDCHANGTFVFDKVSGKVPPMLETNVTVTFTPQRPGNFYRRFYLLLLHQTTLFLDVLGTGFDDNVRPAPFKLAHVDAYRRRVMAGLGLLSPDQLETYWQDNGDELFLAGAVRRLASVGSDAVEVAIPAQAQLLTRSGEASIAAVDACHEFFVSVEHRENAVVVESAFVDFGNCSIVQFPSKKVLHVTNNTHGKVTCAWRVAAEQSAAFQVFPETLDISAGATAEFRIAFQPSTDNTYYFAELEGYVSFKSNRTFRLVNMETFTPPWCVVTKVCGNTFGSPTEQFLPKTSFRLPRQGKVIFPPCFLGDSVFQTIRMDNTGDTPAVFAFTDDPTQVFECRPSSGYIAAKSFHLIQIRFMPRKARCYTHSLQCVVNNARGMPMTLELSGIAALPSIIFADQDQHLADSSQDGRLFIKPTAVGLVSSRALRIRNVTRVPLVYRWEIPHKVQGVFDLSPKIGRLNGRESVEIACRFAPQEDRFYASRFQIVVKSISIPWTPSPIETTHIALLQESTLRVQSKGMSGVVAFEPDGMQFETILVNTSTKCTMHVVNMADCDLQFSLTQRLCVVGGEATTSSGDAAPARLEFSEFTGCISARARKQIDVTFVPRVAGAFVFDVACTSSDKSNSMSTSVVWCTIKAEASFPTIVIDDIRVPGVPTALAWHQFVCHEINGHMVTPPVLPLKSSPRPESPGSDNGNGLEPNIKHIAIPFSPAPLGSPPQQVFLKLRNPGSLVVDFRLQYPKEGNVEIEHWAETGAPSSNEIRTNAIIDSKVFQIAPRRGTLLPQQSITLMMSYTFASDSYGGLHDLPVLLQVEKGTSLVLELQGCTLPRNEPKLFLPRRIFALSPVMIGEYRQPRSNNHGDDDHVHVMQRPPLQQIQVFNRGDTAFRLEVSSNAFGKINQHDYSTAQGEGGSFVYPVLRCITTSEIVAAHSSVLIDLEFAPIEAKTIEANVILKAHGLMGRPYKEVAMVTLLAAGFHPLHSSLSAMRSELALASGGSPPIAQCVGVPAQTARFVNDVVSFKHVPTYGQRTELLVMTNTVSNGETPSAIQFQWEETHPLITSGIVKFSPSRGTMLPGQELLVRVTITTTAQLVVVDHDIACEITLAPHETSSPQQAPINSPSRSDKLMKPRASVVTRSTATQEAARMPESDRILSPVNRDGIAIVKTGASSYRIYAHIYAHVVEREALERLRSDDAETLTLPSTSADMPAPTIVMPWPPNELHACQQVVMDVMETLFADVLSSQAIYSAMLQPPFHPQQPENPLVFQSPRQDEDCAAIATSVMENTVFNILQELFNGDLSHELACMPRKSVFPKATSPRKAIAH